MKRRSGRPRRDEPRNVLSRLIEAAKSRVSASSIEEITVRELASDADTTVAMVNYYFGSKQGLFLATMQNAYSGLEKEIDAIATKHGDNPEHLVSYFLKGLVEHMEKNGHQINIIMDMALSANSENIEKHRKACSSRIINKIQAALSKACHDNQIPDSWATAATSLISSASVMLFFVRGPDEMLRSAARQTIARMIEGTATGSTTSIVRPSEVRRKAEVLACSP